MKKNYLLVFLLISLATNGYSQLKDIMVTDLSSKRDSSNEERMLNDTIPILEFKKPEKFKRIPLYYIDSVLNNRSILKTLSVKFIEDISLDHNETKIDGVKYYGHIFIKTKKQYKPRLISLTDLKQKYTKAKNLSTIFMLNDELIKEKYSNFLVDEKFILKIIVEVIEIKEEKLKVQVIRLLTRTPENAKKANEIFIK